MFHSVLTLALIVPALVPVGSAAAAVPAEAEAHTAYGTVADGPVPTVIDSGQPLIIFEPHFQAEIKEGALTASYSGAGPAAAYFGVGLSAPVKEMGATFAFRGVPSQKAAVGIIPWTSAFNSFPPAPRSSPVHLTITPVSWGVQIWEEGAFRRLHSEYFGHLRSAEEVVALGKNLPADGSLLEAEWQIYGDSVVVHLPNGEAKVLSDPAIGTINAPWPTPEIFYNTGEGAPRVEIRSWWANAPAADDLGDGDTHEPPEPPPTPPPAAVVPPASPPAQETRTCAKARVRYERVRRRVRTAHQLNRSARGTAQRRKARHRLKMAKVGLENAARGLAVCGPSEG